MVEDGEDGRKAAREEGASTSLSNPNLDTMVRNRRGASLINLFNGSRAFDVVLVGDDEALDQEVQVIDLGRGERINVPQDEIRARWWIGHVDDLDVDVQRPWSGLGDTKHVPEDGRCKGEGEFVNSKVVTVRRTLGSEDDWYTEPLVHDGSEKKPNQVSAPRCSRAQQVLCFKMSTVIPPRYRSLRGESLPLFPRETSSRLHHLYGCLTL